MNLVVTVFRHHEGVDFWQFIFIKTCKLGVHKIGGVKNVNMSANFATFATSADFVARRCRSIGEIYLTAAFLILLKVSGEIPRYDAIMFCGNR
jgi:hypothetical protein